MTMTVYPVDGSIEKAEALNMEGTTPTLRVVYWKDVGGTLLRHTEYIEMDGRQADSLAWLLNQNLRKSRTEM